jgi:hypothetical protein
MPALTQELREKLEAIKYLLEEVMSDLEQPKPLENYEMQSRLETFEEGEIELP